jgi:hypothetical protein
MEGRHGHTKSFKAISATSLQASASQNKQVGLNLVNRTSSVNPYIQNITKSKVKELSNSAVIQEELKNNDDI